MHDLDLSPFVLSILGFSQTSRKAPRADPVTMATWLAERGYPPHEAVLEFEASFGGLQVFETDPDAPALLVGPFACLGDRGYSRREGDLVPVIFAWDDVIYSLDKDGRGFALAAMVEGVSRLAARDGRQLLTQAILWRRLARLSGSWVNIDGAEGAARAAGLGLESIPEASSDEERWWGHGGRLVVQIARGNGYSGPRTYVGG